MFSDLNTPQAEAVRSVDGRVLILAGAGSGKTRVLTLRMAYLVKHLNVPPKSILGLTFTNKAAIEMRHRVGQLIDSKAAAQIHLSTFHSFCMQILRSEIHHLGYTSHFSLYDEKDVQRILALIVRDILEHESTLPSFADTTALIVRARNQGFKAHEIKDPASKWHEGFSQQVYSRLQDSMRAYNAVDFDQLLCLTVELFEQNPAVLDKYQEKYRFIMVDEYQDTNPIQYRLASLLASKYNNLCVVGDDDQSIYGWRGAEVKNILNFPNSSLIKLEQNYRSTNTILKAANAVIAHNTERHPKNLWSHRGDGELIEVFFAPNEADEANAVAFRLARLKTSQGLKWKDIAILYRSNALARQFEIALMKQPWQDSEQKWHQGIPFQVFGGLGFYERKEVRDLCAYLRLIGNTLDTEAILRIINYPRRGVGEKALDLVTAYHRKEGIPLWRVLKMAAKGDAPFQEGILPKSQKGAADFVELIQAASAKFQSLYLPDALEWLIGSIGYQKAIYDEVKSDQMRAFKWQNIQEFVSAVRLFSDEWRERTGQDPTLLDFLGTYPLQDGWNSSKQKEGEEDKVSLMTFHSAKGLEFKGCFLVGMEDHIIPHEKSLKETGVEEERRLMYVAITRAMQFLTISMAQIRKRAGKEAVSRPSRFLYEIPKELIRATQWGC